MTSREEVVKRVRDENIEFIRMQFTDIFGTLKSLHITAGQLEKALNNRCSFDGSSIEGFARIEESDMFLAPDIGTFCIMPLESGSGVEARMICNVITTEGKPFHADPRNVLQRVVDKASAMGYEMNVGPECEFFLFKLDNDGLPTTIAVDSAGYFDLDPVDKGTAARKEMCAVLEEMGFEIEAAHHENARGQHEIDFKYSDAIRAADNIMTLRDIVKVVARRHGLHATFMPKPIFGTAGSGMHTNMSLWRDGKNAFYDEKSNSNISDVAKAFMAGVLEHSRAITAMTNPLVNSYKRLVPEFEAPVFIAWSAKNRSPLVRIPAATGSSSRIELRSPDPSCNPYLAFALILTAGLDGIERGLQAPEPIDDNIYAMTREERLRLGVGSLPRSLREAVSELEESELMRQTLGDYVHRTYVTAKRREYEEYSRCVHAWEVEKYMYY